MEIYGGKIVDNTMVKSFVRTYLKETLRNKWCLFDDMVDPPKHCQNCKMCHGLGTMTCEKWYYICVK